MAYKVCIALFAVEDHKHVTEFTKFTSGGTTLIVPTLEFTGSPEDIEDSVKEVLSKLVNTLPDNT